MRETLTTNFTETIWAIKEIDLESGKERSWDIHSRSIEYDYSAPAGNELPSPDYQRKSLPSVAELGIAQVAQAPASLQPPRQALRKGG